MNGKIIGGSICIGISILIVLLFINASDNEVHRMNLISNAVYIENGRITPETEGKYIISSGEWHLEKPAVDDKLNIDPHTPYLVRDVHVKRIINHEAKWSNTHATRDGLGNKIFEGSMKLGDLEIPGVRFSRNTEQYSLPDEEMEKRGYHYSMTYNGFYRFGENTEAIDYRYFPLIKYPKATVFGLQKDSKLDETDDIRCEIWPGVMTKDEVIAAFEDDQKQGMITGIIVSIVFFLLGGLLLFLGIVRRNASVR